MDFGHLLQALDQTMRNLMRSKDFLTLCLLEWGADGHYRIARAGHPAPLLIQGGNPGEAMEIASLGRGLGMRPSLPGTWQIREGLLRPGEWLVMYSDGLTEAVDHAGAMLGLDHFTELLQAHWREGSVHSACAAVFQEVASFETPDRDDRTLFILGRQKV
jgi:serine phosphatase RsbU (regulator of sigma subunit)